MTAARQRAENGLKAARAEAGFLQRKIQGDGTGGAGAGGSLLPRIQAVNEALASAEGELAELGPAGRRRDAAVARLLEEIAGLESGACGRCVCGGVRSFASHCWHRDGTPCMRCLTQWAAHKSSFGTDGLLPLSYNNMNPQFPPKKFATVQPRARTFLRESRRSRPRSSRWSCGRMSCAVRETRPGTKSTRPRNVARRRPATGPELRPGFRTSTAAPGSAWRRVLGAGARAREGSGLFGAGRGPAAARGGSWRPQRPSALPRDLQPRPGHARHMHGHCHGVECCFRGE